VERFCRIRYFDVWSPISRSVRSNSSPGLRSLKFVGCGMLSESEADILMGVVPMFTPLTCDVAVSSPRLGVSVPFAGIEYVVRLL